MGVNTPASSVIIAGLEHPGGQPYSVAEYKNIVGRAGRLGLAERGTSHLLALDPRSEFDLWERYVRGEPEDLVSRFLADETDVRSLIVRVLVAAARAAGTGVTRDEIIGFLEASFGVFQAKRQSADWQWSHDHLLEAINDLTRHGLVEALADGSYHLTRLGRLAGESATEVASIIRLVECLRPLRPEDITDPALIAVVQTTVEVDQVLFPFNKKSTQKEPQLWPNELRGQGVSDWILSAFHHEILDEHQPTLRAKKAVACLLFVSGQPMNEIEDSLTRFGGAFGGAAGPIRGVAARTCDLLPVASRVAEILQPTLDLNDRIGRLTVRLTYGVPSIATDLAREAGAELLRGDYCRLAQAGLCEPERIEAATDEQLLGSLDKDKRKLTVLRDAAKRVAQRRAHLAKASAPVLQAYVA